VDCGKRVARSQAPGAVFGRGGGRAFKRGRRKDLALDDGGLSLSDGRFFLAGSDSSLVWLLLPFRGPGHVHT